MVAKHATVIPSFEVTLRDKFAKQDDDCSLVAGALAYAGPAHRCAPPSPRRAVLRDHAQIVAALGRQAPEQSAQREALARLLAVFTAVFTMM